MATLKQRLYHDMPDGDPDKTIGAHALEAAARLIDDGVTDAQVQAAFDITAGEWTQLKNVAAAVGKPKMASVIVLTQEGYLTPAQADVILGI